MLKPAETDPTSRGGADEERPIGEIVSDLVEDGKAYARAELNLAKAMASAKVSALKAPAILIVAAALVGMAALNALAVAIFILLAMVMKPLLAAILAFLIVGGTAAVLGWVGIQKLKSAL